MPPGALHRLGKGRAVILLPECRPVLASLPAIWQRPGHQRAAPGDFPVRLPVPQPAIEAPRREPIATPYKPAAIADTERPPVPIGLDIPEEVPAWHRPAVPVSSAAS